MNIHGPKYAVVKDMVKRARARGLDVSLLQDTAFVFEHPHELGDTYDEVIAALALLGDVGIPIYVMSKERFDARRTGSETLAAPQASVYLADRWDAEAPDASVSRNGPCPCGSGKKYKRCCGRTP